MRVQELDRKKRYIISANNDNMTHDEMLRLKAEVEKHCLGAVVICGDEIEPERRYYGLYCEQCSTWWTKTGGEICFYPSPEIANAHLKDRDKHLLNTHLWKVQEFGKEEYVPRENLPPNAELCPVIARRLE